MGKYKQVVFVCTGNTCRSPMAEGLLEHYLDDKMIKVKSRGLMVFGPSKANDFALKAMEEKNINIKRHVSKPFDKDELREDALILTMTKGHKTVLIQHGYKGEVYSIKEFVGQDGDVKDPFGGDMGTYRQCADELEKLVKLIGGRL